MALRMDEILEFWFGAGNTPSEKLRALWFVHDPDFDRLCETRFREDYDAAAAGKLDSWKDNARGCLALILLLDQIPRNLFRNSPRAYATDSKARVAARDAIEHGYDRDLTPWQRMFLCPSSIVSNWTISGSRCGSSVNWRLRLLKWQVLLNTRERISRSFNASAAFRIEMRFLDASRGRKKLTFSAITAIKTR
jgi:Bacterial protein of unknown function (DUF924)